MTSALKYRIKLATAVALGAIALVCAGATALSASLTTLDIPLASDLTPAREARARLLAETPGGQARALEHNAAVLRTSPLNTDAYLRQAYVQTRSGAPLDAASLDALERSYTVEPFASGSAHWRLAFIFEHWGEVTPSLRQQAARELEALILAKRPFRPKLINNPSGRLAAILLYEKARRAQAIKQALDQPSIPTG